MPQEITNNEKTNKKIKWTEQFLADMGNELTNFQQNYYQHHSALVYFELEEWKFAKNLLEQFRFKDILHDCTKRVLQTQVYFELRDIDKEGFEKLENYLISFKRFLRKPKVEENVRRQNRYMDFVMVTEKLFKSYEKSKIRTLIEEIKNNKQLPERDWLLKKANEKLKSL